MIDLRLRGPVLCSFLRSERAILSEVQVEPVDVRRDAKTREHESTKDKGTDIADIDALLPIFNGQVSLRHREVHP